MTRSLVLGVVALLACTAPAQADLVYSNTASPINGVETPDLGYTPAFTITVQFTYQPGDEGVLVREDGTSPPSGEWNDSQLEVRQSDGHLLSSVWRYNEVIDLGAIPTGVNTASYSYDPESQTINGVLNGGTAVSAFFGQREDPVSYGLGQYWTFGVADGTNLAGGSAYTDTISAAQVYNTADAFYAVPEPSALVLFGMGMTALAGLGWRLKHNLALRCPRVTIFREHSYPFSRGRYASERLASADSRSHLCFLSPQLMGPAGP